MNSHERFLRDAALVMHREGDVAWGNTCEAAADEIDRLSARNTTAGERISKLERVASGLRRSTAEAEDQCSDLRAALIAAREILQVDRTSLFEASRKNVVYKARNIYGETAHFGVRSAAMAWAKSGTVEDVPVRDLRIVQTLSAQNIDDRYGGRLAFMLECLIVDYHGHWDAACALLDEYKAEWDRVNPQPPTFMGEPMPAARRERLKELRQFRAEIAQKLRALPEFKERGR